MRGSGEFKNGVPHGTLVISYNDLSYFAVQQYNNGMKEGFGRHYKKKNDNLTLIFKGYFKDNMMHGPGF